MYQFVSCLWLSPELMPEKQAHENQYFPEEESNQERDDSTTTGAVSDLIRGVSDGSH